jgi:seryl-tRNA synthetase
MAEFRPGTPEQTEALEAFYEAGLLIPTGAPGLYGRGAAFEDVRLRFEAVVRLIGKEDGAERVAFPPLVPRRQVEDIGYLKSFPHLLGTIFSFEGDERDASELEDRAARHDDWSEFQSMTDLVLLPAACYPVYPAVAARGRRPEGGVMIDAGGTYVFRREPSGDPARLQMFHQREMVRIGEPEAVAAWRDTWRDRAVDLLRSLGLDAEFDVASDPFFGRSGRMLAANQREQALKFEVQVPIAGPEPTAVASFNYHQDHFATVFGLETADGGTAHSACLGFGEERIVMALFQKHGFDSVAWPAEVRAQLWSEAA